MPPQETDIQGIKVSASFYAARSAGEAITTSAKRSGQLLRSASRMRKKWVTCSSGQHSIPRGRAPGPRRSASLGRLVRRPPSRPPRPRLDAFSTESRLMNITCTTAGLVADYAHPTRPQGSQHGAPLGYLWAASRGPATPPVPADTRD